ncbi:MAG TPA: Sua5/YciO/YrdC/YwlC family protein, partial [Pseudonocardiaceae bacterium]|nr:Sua5/YciO/YrdC/YwlC family protein [Pseudonocardiaceae bacterium]
MSTVYDCALPNSRLAGLAAAAGAIQEHQLVVLPTDTVYGLGCDAFSGMAVQRLLAAKGRGRDMPVPVLVGSWSTVDGLVL